MQLSSNATTFYKVIFPSVWLTGFGIGALVVLLNTGSPRIPAAFPIAFPCAWLFGFALCFWLCFPLKHVWLEGGALRVRALKKEVIIPLTEIATVSGSFMQNPETIRLTLRQATSFGSEIKFMPSYRFVRMSPHPTLEYLRQLIEKG